MSIGIPIDRAGGGGFEVTRRGGTGGNLVTDKDRDWTEAVLSGADRAEYDID